MIYILVLMLLVVVYLAACLILHARLHDNPRVPNLLEVALVPFTLVLPKICWMFRNKWAAFYRKVRTKVQGPKGNIR